MPKKPVKKGILKRVLKMMFAFYPKLLPTTIVCIIFSSIAASIPDIYIQKVIKVITDTMETGGNWQSASEQIVPMMLFLVVLYLISTVAITAYSQLMAIITQGTLNKMRQSMFKGMQNLPIKYFDTHK
ncbi:MAG: ABC transporter ATP-binding protein, partial [Oscillospiraceae bacterium]|nr:ABC transporter ATP-binding protein [Oscillospiraceae bacterium]